MNATRSNPSSRARTLLGLFVAFLATFGGVASAWADDFAPININFQKSTSTVPVGYVPDSGAAYTTTVTPNRGWVREDSLTTPSAQHKNLSLLGRDRDRFTPTTEGGRLSGFVIAETAAPVVRGAYEVAVPQGSYKVTVGMGDSGATDSSYSANVEGSPLIQNFVPSASNPFVAQSGVFTVSDGRLTISETGGTNGKFDYVQIEQQVDTAPPAQVQGVTATAGTSQVTLGWTAGTEPDLAGYKIYRSTSLPVPTTGPALNGTGFVTGNTYNDTTVTNGTKYYYAIVASDFTGNLAPASATASATPVAPPPAAFSLKVNFQKTVASVFAGYTPDVGNPYTDTSSFGWVREDSLSSATHVGLDVTARTRDRGTIAGYDRRQTTLTQMNVAGAPNAAWEAAVPVGDYKVTVAAGDPSAFDSTDVINVEGKNAISFPATTSNRMTIATTTVHVTDGRLTIDSIGGTNSKLQYVDISATTDGTDTTPPVPPSNVIANNDSAGIHVSWSPNTEPDLAGYYVYRSLDPSPDVTGTSISGTSPITATSYDDPTPEVGTKYYYAVTAADTSGNRSTTSNPVSGTKSPAKVDLKFNFQTETGTVPVGYTKDFGVQFSLAQGYGWITQDSSATTNHIPLSIKGNPRVRNLVADQRLDSFMHMQLAGTPNAAWEAVVPNGSYDVTVAVGDSGAALDSTDAVNVEGQSAIANFNPTAKAHFATANATVNVADGRLTLDAIGGVNTKIDYVTIKNADLGSRPSVGDVSPRDGATLVSRSRAVTAEVNLPNVGAGVDAATLSADTVRLERVSDGSQVAANRNTSAGGDVIVLQPRAQLVENTQYRFIVTSGLKDVSGAAFIPKTTTFTTGTSTSNVNTIARFIKVPQTAGQGELVASDAIGPDNRLYVTTLDGKVLRFPIDDATGNLGAPTTITTIIDHENGPRHIVGLAFDPASTASAPILWVTTGAPEFSNAPDWTGKLTRLSGPDLSVADDYLTGLPRSARDHETNSIAFGPDGKIYITQGSNSATGDPDNQWGLRKEHLLNAAVLRVDQTAITTPPLDVKTDDGGTYDPFATGAPVTVYASGVRNAYDLVWHSNGQLYVPVNGSAANGNLPSTPATLPAVCGHRLDFGTSGPFTGPQVVGPQHIGVQPDLLFRVQQGKYYGHPNPSRCEYTFFGGNPTTNVDDLETPQYAVGTLPDRNYAGKPSWNFGNHFSPNGAVEYKSTKFGGALNGDLLVARYSAGDDIVALPIDGSTKDITDQLDGIPGLGGLDNPLDIAEDNRNGNLYVTELSETMPEITLIKPDETAGAPAAKVTPAKTIQSAVVNTSSTAQTVTIRNTGNTQLRLTGLTLAGADSSQYTLDHLPAVPQLIDPDQEATVDVRFTPTSVGVKTATLSVTTNDPTNPTTTVTFRGLGTAGQYDANEPSLQRILDTYQTGAIDGDDTPNETNLPEGAIGDEVPIQSLHKAGPGKVTVEPMAVFTKQGPGTSVGSFGWNEVGNSDDLTSIASIPNDSAQTLAPKTLGSLSFDPDTSAFGFWANWAGFDDGNRKTFTQDALNTVNGAASHQARGYPLRDSGGALVPNAYVIAMEEVGGTVHDFNDLVFIVRNVQPDGSGAGKLALTNLDGSTPYDDRMVFNRIGSLTSPPSTIVHDRGTLRLKNTGTTPYDVTGVTFTGPYSLVATPTYPLTVTPTGANATKDLQVKFNATSGRVTTGTMVINTTSALTPQVTVQLAGYWQTAEQGSNEPTLAELVSMLGYGTTITKTGQTLNGHGHVEKVGDEVLSPYWKRLDPSKTVRVTQLSAFHGPASPSNPVSFKWFQKGGSDNPKTAVIQNVNEYQTMLPHQLNSSTAITTGTINPSAEFGFKIDQEFSDPALNSTSADIANGCAAPCGHHMRVWPLKNRAGQLVAGSYIVTMDYSNAAGINFDYNDNTYLVSNLTPDTNTDPVLYRVDTGSTTGFTDAGGQVWSPDKNPDGSGALFTPPGAIEQGNATAAIANTDNDQLYSSYRGNVGSSVPQAQQILEYNLPTRTATKVNVRLYFAEREATAAGQRKEDVSAEGILKLSQYDVFSAAGGKDTGISVALNGIAITDGVLKLTFAGRTGQPQIAGFEVFCAETCGSD